MSEITKGDWKARKVGGAGFSGQIGWAIDFNEDQEQVVDFVYEESDARLIAAAPDLLEALETAEQMLLECVYIGGVTEAGDECLAKARAAIARARGEV